MKTMQTIRRQARSRRLVVIKPSRAEGDRTALQAALGYPVQTKLKVGAPDDAHEREADAVADRVMAMPEATVQRKCASCEQEDEQKRKAAGGEPEKKDEEVQRKAAGGEATVTAASAAAIGASRGGGQTLPAGERAFFEPRLGADLGRVRVHADSEAERLAAGLSARAFTVGGDVYFGRGEYRPGTGEGRRLLAHELAHVAQQGEGDQTLKRKIDRVDFSKKALNVHFSLGIYGPRSSAALASTWASNIENQWNRQLKLKDTTIDAKIHVDAKAYPTLPDAPPVQMAIPESNTVFVEKDGFRSYVEYSCWGHNKWSCGRWAADSAAMVVAHETGHMMGLEDKYKDTAAGSVDLPGYETDIMANFWNDNGKTEFTRAWFGVLIYYYFGIRS
ncbi:MAG: DUF4157 domain-containing protein [Gallionellaceae bacterium]|nr:DUF4157 domain-containing protein [Gallionellaceae bacterium]